MIPSTWDANGSNRSCSRESGSAIVSVLFVANNLRFWSERVARRTIVDSGVPLGYRCRSAHPDE